MDTIRDGLGFIGFCIVLIAFVVVASSPIVAGVMWLTNNACHDFGGQVGYPVKWSVWSGCYVEIDDAWVPSENFWQYVRVEKQGGE